ncbi:MAG: hypothetical protein RIR26_1861, partial [Pseudomonadota bacterium]
MYLKAECHTKKILLSVLMLTCTAWAISCTRKPDRVLRVLSFRDRQSTALRNVIPEFEKKYAIRVQFDDIPAATVATKMMTDLAAGGTYDVYTIDEP